MDKFEARVRFHQRKKRNRKPKIFNPRGRDLIKSGFAKKISSVDTGKKKGKREPKGRKDNKGPGGETE